MSFSPLASAVPTAWASSAELGAARIAASCSSWLVSGVEPPPALSLEPPPLPLFALVPPPPRSLGVAVGVGVLDAAVAFVIARVSTSRQAEYSSASVGNSLRALRRSDTE